MKKRFLATLLALVLTIAMVISPALAVSASNATLAVQLGSAIDSTNYSSISDCLNCRAVEAVNQDNMLTIKLLSDVEENIVIPSGAYVTIDLNGYVLSGDGTSCVIYNKGNLTIKDSNATSKHYFNYSNNGAWTLNSAATSGISLSSIDSLNTENGTVIEVLGGCITGGIGYGFGPVGHQEHHGGGIYSENILTIQGGNIVGNQADGIGGGIATNEKVGTITMTGGSILGNCCPNYVGGLAIRGGGDNKISNATIAGNVGYRGSGIYYYANYDGTVTISESKISDNIASCGGGIYNSGYSKMIIVNSTIEGNVATEDGGGICNVGYMKITGTAISNNIANGQAAGVATYTKGSALIIGDGTVITKNIVEGTETYPSGGVYSWDGPIKLTGKVVISENVNNDANGEWICDSNLCLDGKKAAQLVTLSELSNESSIGVSTMKECAMGGYKFTATTDDDSTADNATSNEKKVFTSDSNDYYVYLNTNYLELANCTVKVAKPITNGTVLVSDNGALSGTEVTVTATSNENYVLDKITITDCNGNDITSTVLSGTTITVPEASVLPITVNAIFKPDYKIKETGSDATWTKGGTTGQKITSTADFSKFVSVSVDGKVVDAANYDKAEGSTIITFKPAYLETLSVGDHTVVITSTDGKATGVLTIEEETKKEETKKADVETVANTADNSAIGAFVALSAFAAAGYVSLKKKEN